MKCRKRVLVVMCIPFLASGLATASLANGSVGDDAAEFFTANANIALESADENTSDGAISAPETYPPEWSWPPQLPPEEAPAPPAATPPEWALPPQLPYEETPALPDDLPDAFPISEISETTYESEQTAQTDIVDVLLPSDIPFDIVIFNSTGDGFITSSDFLITNNNAFSVDVVVCDACVTVANEDAFSVRSDKNLPENGNNIYINMIQGSDAGYSNSVLDTRPNGENFRFVLESGASDTFRFEGVVNEHGNMRWGDTTVTISLRFEIAITGAESGI
jgi:hypothetical protein